MEHGLRQLPGPHRIFLQYVPTAMGLRGMNVPLIRWLSANPAEVWVQFHEVALGWQLWRKPHHHLIHGVQLWMASALARRANRIFVSIEGWRPRLGRRANRAVWLPIPSNLPVAVSEEEQSAARKALGPGRWIAHFGTYGSSITRDLVPTVRQILEEDRDVGLLLLGRGADRVAASLPRERVNAPGELSALEVAARLSIAELALQPFPDGISTRRTSAMAALALGVPVVTTRGHLTDSIWTEDVVALTAVGDVAGLAQRSRELLADPRRREALGRKGAQLYHQHFSLERSLRTLLPETSVTLASHR
jgi:hypothetical protein